MPDTVLDRAKQMVGIETDRPHVFREMVYCCRPAGLLSIPGVYLGFDDMIPLGTLMNKGLTIRTGQTHVNRWTDDLLRRIEEGQIDPSFVITHEVPLEKGLEMYKVFRDKQDGCVKVVLRPDGLGTTALSQSGRACRGNVAILRTEESRQFVQSRGMQPLQSSGRSLPKGQGQYSFSNY